MMTMYPDQTYSRKLTETRTVTIELFGSKRCDFETVLVLIEAAMQAYDDTGTVLDWNIKVEA